MPDYTRIAASPYRLRSARAKILSALSSSGTSGGGPTKIPLGPQFQSLVNQGLTTDPAAQQLEALDIARKQVQAGKKPGIGGISGLLAKAKHGAAEVALTPIKTGLAALDLISRPGLAVTTAEANQIRDVKNFAKDPTAGNLLNVAKGVSVIGRAPELKMGLLKEKGAKSGAQVVNTAGWQSGSANNPFNRIAHGVAGFGVDLVSDPTSWYSLGTTSSAAKIGESLAQSGVEGVSKNIAETETKKLVREVSKGAAKKSKRLVTPEADAIALRVKEAARETLEPALHSQTPLATVTGDNTYQKILDAARSAGGAPLRKIELDKQIEELGNAVHSAVMDSAGKGRFAFRPGFMGKGAEDALAGSKIGEALYKPVGVASDLLGKYHPINVLNDAFNVERHFPGITGRIRAAASSLGYNQFSWRKNQILALFQHTTAEQRKSISHAIEDGIQFPVDAVDGKGVSLNKLMEDAKAMFKTMGEDDVKTGIRTKNELLSGDRYLYHYFPKSWKNPTEVADWAAKRSALMDPKLGSNVGVTLNDAIKNGLNPEEDIAKILLARQAKGSRDLTRHWYRHEVINGYGTLIRNDANKAFKDGLTAVDEKNLTPQMKALARQAEGAYYLPNDIHKTFNTMVNMQRINDPAVNAFSRTVDRMNRGFKFASTVPNPGYHIRNMMGDALFSMLDSGDPRDYGKLGLAMQQIRHGKIPSFIMKDGTKIDYHRLINEYKTRIGVGGFMPSDVSSLPGEGISLATNRLKQLTGKARTVAEGREDFGRIAHFKSAFEQEYASLAKGKNLVEGSLEQKDVLNRAYSAAADRVNKFNIDYHALTPFEQKTMKRVIPFYTFQRKATPLMMEQMLTNPGRVLTITKAEKAIQDMLGVKGTLPFTDFGLPDFMKEPGMIRTNNEAQPSFIDTTKFSPTSILSNAIGGSADPHALLTSTLSRLAPALRLPFEVQSGKSFFSGRPISDLPSAVFNEADPTKALRAAISAKQGAKSGTGLPERLASWAGAPYYRSTTGRQVGATKFATEKYKAQEAVLNAALNAKGYDFVSTSKGGQRLYRIVDAKTREVLFESSDPAKARKFANKLY